MRFLYPVILLALSCPTLLLPTLASAQTVATISDQLTKRSDDVLRLLQGAPIETEIFDENFLNAIPPEQFRALTAQIVAQQGQPLAISSILPRSGNSAILGIRFERSIGTVHIDLERNPPHRISGLMITGFEAAADTLDEVVAGIDALPGRQGLLVRQLGATNEPALATLDADGRYAIASTFKLYILAELDRAVRAGERQWSDVVSLGPKSHPSGISQNWPDAAPVTLHTLATLMISISDNSATDTLIEVIGQERLAKMVGISGHHQPDWLRPFLMTRQASALKMPAHTAHRNNFLAADQMERGKLLATIDDALTLASIDPRVLTNRPAFIDQLEWFATPADIVRLMDYLRQNASAETRAILAINPGIGPDAARKWEFLGYKGGSEPGVLSYNFLLRSRGGKDFAVSIHWNNEDQSLQEGSLLALTTRLVNLLVDHQ